MVRTSSLMAIRRVTVLPNMGAVSLGLDSGISKLTNRHSSSSIIQKPTLDSVQNLNLKPSGLSNESLIIMSNLSENFEATHELLIRHVMDVDDIEYDEASKKCRQIEATAREGMFITTIPYKIGIFAALTTGFGAIPMVFDLDLALWFNERFVTADVADDKDLETWLEVGGWTWNWMEPVLGTASFVLLALQFSRAQLENLTIRPFTRHLRVRRGMSLVKIYPQYDKDLLISFGKLITYY